MYDTYFVSLLQVGAGRERRRSHPKCPGTGIDLIIADIPEGLPVPNVSTPYSLVPSWNELPEGYVGNVFDFASIHLHDDAALLLIHPDSRALCDEIQDWCETYEFEVYRDWWGVNELRLSSPKDPSKMVINST